MQTPPLPPSPLPFRSSWFQRNHIELPSLCIATTLGAVPNSLAFVSGVIGSLTSFHLKMPSLSLIFIPLGIMGLTNSIRHVYSYWRLAHRLHKRQELDFSIRRSRTDEKKYIEQLLKLDLQIQSREVPPEVSQNIAGELASLRACLNQREQLRIRWQQIAFGISRAMNEFDQDVQSLSPCALEEGRGTVSQILSFDDLQRAKEIPRQIHEARNRWFSLISHLDRSLQRMKEISSERDTLLHQYEHEVAVAQQKLGPDQEKILQDLLRQQERLRSDLERAQAGLQSIMGLRPEAKVETVQEVALRTLSELSRASL